MIACMGVVVSVKQEERLVYLPIPQQTPLQTNTPPILRNETTSLPLQYHSLDSLKSKSRMLGPSSFPF